MIAAVASAWSLLLGFSLLMLGNGLLFPVLGVRAGLEGFSTTMTGIVNRSLMPSG